MIPHALLWRLELGLLTCFMSSQIEAMSVMVVFDPLQLELLCLNAMSCGPFSHLIFFISGQGIGMNE